MLAAAGGAWRRCGAALAGSAAGLAAAAGPLPGNGQPGDGRPGHGRPAAWRPRARPPLAPPVLGAARPARAVCCDGPAGPSGSVRIAFVGNSYQYFNDLPRLLQFMCALHGEEAHIDSCLRGGSSWKSILREGNDMAVKFGTPNALRPDGTYDIGAPSVQALFEQGARWDYAVLNTFSTEAATVSRRPNGLEALEVLGPLLEQTGARPVLLVTPAYGSRGKPVVAMRQKEVARIGTWEDFVWKQSEGFRLYAAKLHEVSRGGQPPRVADANLAFEVVHGEWPELYERLLHTDGFHPTPLGSWLQACVVFCAMHGQVPPLPAEVLEDPGKLFARARRMLPPPALPVLPTSDELIYLRGVAARTFGGAALLGARDAGALGPAA